MNIGVPRWIVVSLAVLFQAYDIVALGIYSLEVPNSPYPAIAAMAIFAVATAVSLLPFGGVRLPVWVAALCFTAVVCGTLLVTSQLPLHGVILGYATWYVAAAGALMTIVSTRQRPVWAWLGIAFLVTDTIVWAGPINVINFGVIGSMSWVTVSSVISRTLTRAARDSQSFSAAERGTADWQAAQEAHVTERQFRLGQTSAMAFRMLETIVHSNGELTPEQRQESLHLEGAIRDEIRGRKLLNDAVRDEVMDARRRGVMVTLLDEGGIDDLSETDLDRVLNTLAAAIHTTDAVRVIARTAPEDLSVAVTVVGLREADDHARMLGRDDDEEVALWLEIPRFATDEGEVSRA
ncbi:MAG TPA: hypothetical protein VN759_03385 [Pseudolysinimonas sp.]|nr:hypothetical protein [Pseudolysinimonas sp.]